MKQRDRAKDDIHLFDISRLDPNGGVLVSATYWRPREGDPDPEHPGEKIAIVSYLPTRKIAKLQPTEALRGRLG